MRVPASGANRKSCIEQLPIARTTSCCAVVSMPSAMVRSPSACAMPTMARMMASLFAAAGVVDQRAVDLQLVERRARKLREFGEAVAEVVQRDLHVRPEVLDDRFAQRLAPIDDPRPARAAHPAHID